MLIGHDDGKILENRQIVIWGIGPVQADIQAIFNLKYIAAYIEDNINAIKLINVSKELIISSKDLSKYASKETLFLLCTEDKDYAIRKILSLGLGEENYVLAEELLLHHELINAFYQSDITVFGIGNTYEYWKNDLNESKLNITRFALTKREVDKFNQKDVININELENFNGKTKIVVTSIYYNEIYKSLISKGFAPGVDFIHINTFLILNNLSKNININYKFINRSEGNKSLLVVLSGYKEILWGKVFDRIKNIALEILMCV